MERGKRKWFIRAVSAFLAFALIVPLWTSTEITFAKELAAEQNAPQNITEENGFEILDNTGSCSVSIFWGGGVFL